MRQPANAPSDFYRRDLPHLEPGERTVFVTFCTVQRWVLPEAVRGLVLEHCLHDHPERLWMHALVVMPDHVHLLFSPYPDQGRPERGLSRLLRAMKGCSARSINVQLGRQGPVWQPESFDRIMRSDESIAQKSEYIISNPVRRGLVAAVDDYAWLWREWVEGATP